MVSEHFASVTVEVVPKVFDGPYHSKCLQFRYAIVLLMALQRPTGIGHDPSSRFWAKTAPNPLPDASVSSKKHLVKSGKERTGA